MDLGTSRLSSIACKPKNRWSNETGDVGLCATKLATTDVGIHSIRDACRLDHNLDNDRVSRSSEPHSALTFHLSRVAQSVQASFSYIALSSAVVLFK
mmetsp:Transcript_17003/g.23786  ORF Transcript_17003/g.23786 Transcript_17003/m.23786 type:complete len:97 (-) Transcript_17003:297-587(-)